MSDSTASTFLQRTKQAQKVVVVDLGFLGDSVHLVPVLWELRRHYPAAEIHAISAPVGAETLRLAPCVTRTWAYPLPPRTSCRQQWEIIAALRRERFDVAYNFSGADRSIFLTALTGARHRLARVAREHFWARWLIRDWVPRRDTDLPVFEQRRRVLAACGFSLQPARFDLTLPPEARQWASQRLGPEAVHLSINASGPEKEWPLEHWSALARTLLENKPALELIATASPKPRERERLAHLRAAVDSKRLVCFDGLSIAQLAALLERCRLHIGADSGVLHLAMALGVPTLGLFRQYEGLQEWLPRGETHRHLVAQSMDSISSAAAAAEVDQVLAATRDAPPS